MLQNLSKENIQSESLPELVVSFAENNIVTRVEKISCKFRQIEKDSPHLMVNFIFTVKKLSGPLKILVQNKDTLEEIIGCLVTKYIQGSGGLDHLYNLRSIKDSCAFDSGASVRNIEQFSRTTSVVQHLDVMDNATNVLVSSLAEQMFLYHDLMSWHKFRAKNARVKPLESATESKVLRIY